MKNQRKRKRSKRKQMSFSLLDDATVSHVHVCLSQFLNFKKQKKLRLAINSCFCLF